MSNLYCQKRPTFKAVQVKWANWSDICDLLGPKIGEHNPATLTNQTHHTCGDKAPYIKLNVPQPDNTAQVALHGDWLVKDEQGNITVYTNSDFNKKFEEAV